MVVAVVVVVVFLLGGESELELSGEWRFCTICRRSKEAQEREEEGGGQGEAAL